MSKFIEVRLTRVNWDTVCSALDSPDGFGQEHEPSQVIRKTIISQLDHYCDSAHGGRHVMVKPDDTDKIQWGEFGICTECHIIRKMPREFVDA